MSKDIRSFFKVCPKKTTEKPISQASKQSTLVDSDEDIIEGTPEEPKKGSRLKRLYVLSSDSEDDCKSKKKSSPKKKKKSSPKNKKKSTEKSKNTEKLKPISIDNFNQAIKQSEVKPVLIKDDKKSGDSKQKKENTKKKSKKEKNTELGVHNDKDFETTLEALDEDDDDTILLDNMDFLDKTMEEATSAETLKSSDLKQSNKLDKKETAEKKTKQNDKKISKNNNSPVTHKKTTQNSPKKADKRPRKNSESSATPKKRQKLDKTDSGIDPGTRKPEKNRQNRESFVAYIHRPGPKHHGEKEYPKGKPDCLKGLTFLRTGVLDSLEGEEFGQLVSDHGGRVVHAVSKKVNYIVVGLEPGPSKLAKARNYKIPEISEDEFLDIILTKSGMEPKFAVQTESEDMGIGGSEESPESDKILLDIEFSNLEEKIFDKHIEKEINGKSFWRELPDNKAVKKSESSILTEGKHGHQKTDTKEKKLMLSKSESQTDKLIIKDFSENVDTSKCTDVEKGSKDECSTIGSNKKLETLSWTDKYKPTNSKGIIGQQDTNSNLNKLKRWLQNWNKNSDPNVRKSLPKPTLYNQYDGAYFKAALLSGPPGVGKTTTATLVARELGYDIVEFNASDTRSKKLLHEEILHMMGSKTVAGFASGEKNINQKRILLMDEVDGMAGNEDRGGIAELINFIKTAKFPIICMCNNRDLPKMRTLVNHCYGLKFGKPNLMQVKGAMMSICFKEGLTIKPDVLAQLITGTGCDIRQTLNHLCMWSAAEKQLSSEVVEKESKNSRKDTVFGVWDVIRKVFNKSENKDMSLADKARLFFYDYSFGPVFVLENYLTVEPEIDGTTERNSPQSFIRRFLTADCLSQSDLIERKIRSTNNWALLESQAFYSTVLPSYYLSGKMEQVRFPAWFGKNSQKNKNLRIISEIYTHARTKISGNKLAVLLDYATPLVNRLVNPLVEKDRDGIDDTLEVLKAYSLLRDDLTNLCELTTSYGRPSPFDKVSSKAKAALTRKYNKTVVLSFAPPTASKKKKTAIADKDELLIEDDDLSDNEEDDAIDTDGLVKIKTDTKSKAGSSKTTKSQGEIIQKEKSAKSSDTKTKNVKGKAKK